MQFIGVIHLEPLPGSPRAQAMSQVLAAATEDARAYLEGGVDALIVENFGDAPFFATGVEPVTVAAMAVAVREIRQLAGELPVGVNVLRNDGFSALSVAHVCGASFVRVNVHVGAAVTDQGIVQGDAARLLRLRQQLGAEVAVYADVAVKHAVPLGSWSDPLNEARDATGRGLADALIVTGHATGQPIDLELARAIRDDQPGVRLLAGSGVEPGQAEQLRGRVDGAIVGTWAKGDGQVGNRVDAGRVRQLRRALDGEVP